MTSVDIIDLAVALAVVAVYAVALKVRVNYLRKEVDELKESNSELSESLAIRRRTYDETVEKKNIWRKRAIDATEGRLEQWQREL